MANGSWEMVLPEIPLIAILFPKGCFAPKKAVAKQINKPTIYIFFIISTKDKCNTRNIGD